MIKLIRIRAGVAQETLLSTDLADGQYIVIVTRCNPLASESDYRAVYFSKIDFLSKEVGEKKYDLHDMIKNELLEDYNHSTKDLTPDEWRLLLERFELWAFVTYNTILP